MFTSNAAWVFCYVAWVCSVVQDPLASCSAIVNADCMPTDIHGAVLFGRVVGYGPPPPHTADRAVPTVAVQK